MEAGAHPRGRWMSVDTELLELAREVQAYDVRLRLLSNDRRNGKFRRELEELRAAAAAKLAEAEAAHGWSTDEPSSAG
jgi:hypothetical protein